jgi:hypothetical protein
MTKYAATEKDVCPTIDNFEIFCRYIEERKPRLSRARGELGKKDCFAINALLSKPRDLDGPKYLQPSYPSINLFFHIILETGLFILKSRNKGETYLMPSLLLEKYRALDPSARYLLLFRTYWTRLDFDQLYCDSSALFHHFMYTKLAFEALKDAQPNERIFANVEDFERAYDLTNPVHRLFVGAGMIVPHLRDFGFWEYEEANIPVFHTTKKEIRIKAVTPTPLGIAMINACCRRPYEIYNERRDEQRIGRNWCDESLMPIIESLGLARPSTRQKIEPFEQAFEQIFPAVDAKSIGIILKHGKEKPTLGRDGNVYVFKVSYGRNIWRRIKISKAHSLHYLHEAIQEAFEFDNDHGYAFFMDGRPWSPNAYWDRSTGDSPFADRATIGKLELVKGQKILYLFDFGDEWMFTVRVDEILYSDVPPVRPVVVEKKGDAPVQYPDWDE